MVTTKQLLDKLYPKSYSTFPQPEDGLTPAEIQVAVKCEEIHASTLTAKQKLEQIIPLLKEFSAKPLSILKLCNASPAIKAACHADSPLLAAWGNALVKKHVPGGEALVVTTSTNQQKTYEHGGKIKAVDGKKGLEVVDLLISGGVFTQYEKTKEPMFLDYACEQGYYAALRVRCDQTRAKIHEFIATAVPTKETNAQFDLLRNDLTRLGNLYWTVGYLDAACILRDMGTVYANSIAKDDDNSFWRDKFCEEAALNVYLAEALSEKDISQHISHDMYDYKGGIKEVYHYQSWNDAVDDALKPLNLSAADLISKKIEIREEAMKQIKVKQSVENVSEAKLRS